MTGIWETPDGGKIIDIEADEMSGSIAITTDKGGIYILDAERLLDSDTAADWEVNDADRA